MPISVDYLPPMQLLADAAWMVGAGQYAQRQQDDLLRARQLDQQYQLAQDNQAARMSDQQQDRLENRARMQMNAANQDFARQQQHANALERQNLANQFRADTATASRLNALDDITRREEEAAAARMWGYEVDTAGDLDRGVGTTMGNYAKQRKFMTPEGQKLHNDLSVKWAAIQKQRPEIRPAQYASLVSQFNDELSRSGLEEYIEQPKTTPEAFAEETLMTEHGLVGRDRNGAWRLIAKPGDDGAAETAKKVEALEKAKVSFVESFVGKTRKNAQGDDVPYTAQEIHKLWKDREAVLRMIDGTGESDKMSQTVPPPPMPGQPSTPTPPHPEQLLQSLPRANGYPVATPQQAAMLPPGTVFMTQDGRRARVPSR